MRPLAARRSREVLPSQGLGSRPHSAHVELANFPASYFLLMEKNHVQRVDHLSQCAFVHQSTVGRCRILETPFTTKKFLTPTQLNSILCCPLSFHSHHTSCLHGAKHETIILLLTPRVCVFVSQHLGSGDADTRHGDTSGSFPVTNNEADGKDIPGSE